MEKEIQKIEYKITLPDAGQKTPEMRFGRWTVISGPTGSAGNLKYLCRCDCGIERYVLKRSLMWGKSLSCGCLARDTKRGKVQSLIGMTFGDLTVIAPEAEHIPGTEYRWLCRCTCGKECLVRGTRLVTGKQKSCGCKGNRNHSAQDITGQKFRRLTALYPTEQRDYKGCIIWHCRCECGNEVDVSYNTLVYGNIISCGCRKEEQQKELKEHVGYVAGTAAARIMSRKPTARSTTGVRGVRMKRGRYAAEIGIQKKNYYLGSYKDLETAAAVRKEAEETIFDSFLEHYELWKERASADQAWGADHPIDLKVEKGPNGRFQVMILPTKEEILGDIQQMTDIRKAYPA